MRRGPATMILSTRRTPLERRPSPWARIPPSSGSDGSPPPAWWSGSGTGHPACACCLSQSSYWTWPRTRPAWPRLRCGGRHGSGNLTWRPRCTQPSTRAQGRRTPFSHKAQHPRCSCRYSPPSHRRGCDPYGCACKGSRECKGQLPAENRRPGPLRLQLDVWSSYRRTRGIMVPAKLLSSVTRILFAFAHFVFEVKKILYERSSLYSKFERLLNK